MYGYRSGSWSVAVVEAPAEEPLTLSAVKLHCRIDSDAEDELLALAVQAAREYVESFTRRTLVTQTLRLSLDVCPTREILLPRPPLASVVQIAYDDDAGDEQLVLDVAYRVDRRATPGRVRLLDGAPCSLRPTRVDYVAGYGAASAVPAAIRQAMLLLVGDMYENREAAILGTIVAPNPTVANLLGPFLLREIA